MTCHVMMTLHGTMTCYRMMTCQGRMICHHMKTCQGRITCHHMKTCHHMMTCHGMMTCHEMVPVLKKHESSLFFSVFKKRAFLLEDSCVFLKSSKMGTFIVFIALLSCCPKNTMNHVFFNVFKKRAFLLEDSCVFCNKHEKRGPQNHAS